MIEDLDKLSESNAGRLRFADIGINLTNKRFDKDREELVEAALNVGVDTLIITGTNLAESQKAEALCQTLSAKAKTAIYSTAGCHPHDASSMDKAGFATLTTLAQKTNVVAVGECGLDFNRDFSPRDKQVEVFEWQLQLAMQIGKPVFLHERDAFDTQYPRLKAAMNNLKGGVAHCFTGSKDQMKAYLDLGLYIGITGWICDERRGQELLNSLKYIPDDRLLLETDGPYLLPRDLRPKPKSSRNLPAYLPHIAERVAQARGQSLKHIAEISYCNSRQLFGLSEKN